MSYAPALPKATWDQSSGPAHVSESTSSTKSIPSHSLDKLVKLECGSMAAHIASRPGVWHVYVAESEAGSLHPSAFVTVTSYSVADENVVAATPFEPTPKRRLRSVGAGRSGRGDLARRNEEILADEL